MSIESSRFIGLSLVAVLISSIFCILTAIRDRSADAERVNASNQNLRMPDLRAMRNGGRLLIGF